MPTLSPERWREIDTLLDQVLDRPADERTAFLRAACGDDPALYAAVEGLLAADDEAEGVLGESIETFAAPLLAAVAADVGQSDDDARPEAVGPYRILSELGRGGMGTVYLAERSDGTFARRVALKLVRRGMDTDEVLRRFHAERRILAVLDHPNVARILDAGAADDGRPYFAMEFVEGEPITTYCDGRRLGVDERLRLFEAVCGAVQHAHRHLVVHRDLKPGNVLVAAGGGDRGEPVVKLLDFGIARLLEEGTDPEVTRAGRVLTPAYASPEQRSGAPISTASDVYQLGLLLHELLTGRRPVADGRPSAGVDDEAAAARGITTQRLQARLAGDLDVIVTHALEDEPDRRYPSAEALAADVRRHLASLPVLARPQSRSYRAGRFIRRHRAGVATAALMGTLLVGSGIALAVAGRAATRERDRARSERDRAEATIDMLEGLFTAADPMAEDRLDTLRARDLLARGVARADADLRQQPLVRAQLLHAIGDAYTRLGLHDEALPLLQRALALRASRGASADDLASTEHALGVALTVRGRHPAAEHMLRRALARREGAGRREPLRVAETEAALAEVLQAVGRTEEAESRLRRALSLRRVHAGPESPLVADNLGGIAGVQLEQGRLPEAEAAYGDAIEAYAALPRPAPGELRVLAGLGFLYTMQDRPADAEATSRRGIALIEERLGADHWRMGLELTSLAAALYRQGKLDEAQATIERAMSISPRRPQDRAITLGTLANVLADQGDTAGAVAAQRDALAILEAAYGATDPVTAASRAKLERLLAGGLPDAPATRPAPAGPAGHSASPVHAR